MDYIPEHIHFNFRLMIKELIARGITVNFIENTDIVEAEYNGQKELLINCDSRLNPSIYVFLFSDKFKTKRMLEQKGFSVAPGQIFTSKDLDLAMYYATKDIGFPVILKPNIGAGGEYIFANIDNSTDFIVAFRELSKTHPDSILVEKYLYSGVDYRFFTVKNGYQAAVKRTPPSITGDGCSTLLDLIQNENHRRMNPRSTCLCKIFIEDIEGVRMLQKNGYKIKDIIPEGKVLQLRDVSNVAYGGFCEDATGTIDKSYFELAQAVFQHCPGLNYAAIDFLIKDPTVPATKDNYAVCEINHRPGFSLHLMPGAGKSRNVIAPLIDLLFPETKK